MTPMFTDKKLYPQMALINADNNLIEYSVCSAPSVYSVYLLFCVHL